VHEGKTVLDLASLLHAQLRVAGVRDVRDCGICTFDSVDGLYSYRRGDGDHRILSFAVMC